MGTHTDGPREASTYRAARRNAAKGRVWQGVKPTKRLYRAPVRRKSIPQVGLTGGCNAEGKWEVAEA